MDRSSPHIKRVTSADVAKRVGVSRPTVSAVFGARGGTRVSQDLRQRILDAANRMGYRTNTAARAMRRGRFGAIGVVQATESNRGNLSRTALYAIQTRAVEHDMHLTMGMVPDENLSDPAGLPKVLREWCVDGLLISYTSEIPALMNAHIERHCVPAIWMNIKNEQDCVYLDDFGGSRGATDILLELGHRRIAYYGPQPSPGWHQHYSVTDRFEGYAVAMKRAGFKPAPLFQQAIRVNDLPVPGESVERLVQHVRSPDRPTAIVVTAEAADVLCAARLAGLSVPRDLSLVVLTEGIHTVLGVKPTQMRLHTFGMGYRAFDQLVKKVQRPRQPLDPVAVYCTFDRGQTLAAPAAR